MIVVHHLNLSRSHRVLWLLEELGVEYRIQAYRRTKAMLAPPELKAVHPLGKSPVITDGDQTVAESGAIFEYLLEQYGDGRLQPPPGTHEYRRFRYWMHFAEGSFMPYLVMKLIFSAIPGRSPVLVRPIARGIVAAVEKGFLGPNLKGIIEYLEDEAGRSTWLAGDQFTAADIQMSFPIEASEKRAANYGFGPNLTALLARMRERPGYQRALEKGGPVTLG